MAHHGGTENPQKHHPNLPATPLARTQSGRKHMAIYTRQLAIQQGLRHLRRHRRGQLRGLEPPHRQALENHVHRTEKMGARRLIIRAVGISVLSLLAVHVIILGSDGAVIRQNVTESGLQLTGQQ